MHFTWSQQSVVPGRHGDRGSEAYGVVVVQVGIESLLRASVLEELRGAGREEAWRVRVMKAVENFDARQAVDGARLQQEAEAQVAS